jgi:hypothetical protein
MAGDVSAGRSEIASMIFIELAERYPVISRIPRLGDGWVLLGVWNE